jgi:polyphosphate kinase 2 (PPK2 family)
MQLKHFSQDHHNPLKLRKLSPIEYTMMGKWDGNASARIEMCGVASPGIVRPIVVGAGDKLQITLDFFSPIARFVRVFWKGYGRSKLWLFNCPLGSHKPLRLRLSVAL